MDVDEPGQHEPCAAVDHPVGRAGEIAAEMDDAVFAEGEVNLAAVGVMVQRLVPGDHPGGILYHGGGHVARSQPRPQPIEIASLRSQ
jgi:hypothetical protein